MRSEDESRRVLNRALDLASESADSVEAALYGARFGITKFSDNAVTQSTDGNIDSLNLRLSKDGRQGVCSTTDLTDTGIREALKSISQALSHQYGEAEENNLPNEQEYVRQVSFDQATESASAVDRMSFVGRTLIRAHAHQLVSTGYVATSFGCDPMIAPNFRDPYAVTNSNGLWAYHGATNAVMSVGMIDQRQHEGWAKASSFMLGSLNVDGIAEVAAQKACAPGELRILKPGRYRCVLEPAAVKALLAIFAETCGTSLSSQGGSIFSENIGTRITSDKITIRDDFSHEDLRGCPYDVQGVARKVVPLIVKGVPTQTVTSFSTAQRLGIDPTGHGCFSPERGAYESAKCIVMEGGETSLVELVTDCQQAILISSLGDVRLLDPKTMTLSGTTRDGTYLIRNGQVVAPVSKMSFVVNLFELFNQTEELSTAISCDKMVVPAIRVAEFGLEPL